MTVFNTEKKLPGRKFFAWKIWTMRHRTRLIFQLHFPWLEIPKHCKRRYIWQSGNLHNVQWSDGNTSYNYLPHILTVLYRLCNNEEICRLIANHIHREVNDVEKIIKHCPSFRILDAKHWVKQRTRLLAICIRIHKQCNHERQISIETRACMHDDGKSTRMRLRMLVLTYEGTCMIFESGSILLLRIKCLEIAYQLLEQICNDFLLPCINIKVVSVTRVGKLQFRI